MTKYHRNNMRMTVSRFHNSEHNHKTGGDKSSMGKIKCNINNITCDIINCSENGRFNQCTKRHHCNGAKSNNEKPNEEKRHRERRKVKYDHEKGKTGLPARSIESKCEKYIVKISNISKYTVEENEFSTGKNTLSSDDLIICRNYKMSHFLWKKCERKSDEQYDLALVRDKREMREEVEGANGNENRSSQLCLNWVHSMSDGGNNNAVISVEEKKEGSEKDEQETVNDELKDVAPLLKHNETEQAGDEGKLNDNVGEHTSAHGNINKSNSTATLFNINLHSLCQFTKTIPKQLLRMARISKTILEEELTKRKLRETPRQQNATRDDEMDDLNRPNQSSNEVRNDKIVRRAGTSKFWVDLETWINLDRNMDVLSSLCPDATNSKDELKDNALEEEEDEEEELKDELGEMGSNISRHSGKGLSGRRTQSSGNLCNGKLVSNVGKLLVPCTKQGDELTSPNRYKLCASLPNYLEKENLDDLEPCKFPYGINNNNNNNNNNELEFYDIKKDLDFGLKPILRANSRSEDYVTKEKKDCKPDRSPDEECPPDILNQQILQDRGGGGEDRTGSDQQLCQVHPFVNQNSSTFLVCIEKGTRGLGLSVMGGCDTEDHLIRIKRIFPHTPAAQCGVLCQGDVILTVNDVPLTGLTNYEALEVLRMTYNIVHLKVYRPPDVSQNKIPDPPSDPPPPPPKREALSNILVPVFPADEDEASREFDIVLTKHNGSLGFTLRKEDESVLGHYVRALVREPALSDGRIQQGDKIVAVNGVEMSRMSHEEAVQFLRQCGEDVRLRLYRDATQTPVAALSPCRQHKQLKPILRKEAMDMLSDLAVKKLSPQPSTNSSRSSSPRCRKLKPSSDQNSQHHPDSRILSPTRPDSLDFNNREKKTRYQFSSPESDTGTPSSCSSSNSSSIASQILPPPLQAPPPMLDEPASLPPALPSSPPPLPHSHEPASMPPLFSSPESPPYFLIKDTDDPYKASMDLSKSYPNPSDPYKASMDLSKSYTTSSNPYKASMDLSQSKCCTNSNEPYKANMELGQSKSYPHPSPTLYQDAEPSSMPPLGSETLTSDAFTHGNPSYQSTIPVSSKKLEAKLDNGAASIPDLPAMLSPPPVESSKGLLKWKGVVFSPDESGDQMDSIKPPLAFSVSSDGDDQIVVVELNRGWNSRLGFSLADGPESSTVISAIHADSVASRDGRLKVGDQIVMVNDESVEAMSTPDIIDLLRKIRGSICIRVHRKNKVKSASKEI